MDPHGERASRMLRFSFRPSSLVSHRNKLEGLGCPTCLFDLAMSPEQIVNVFERSPFADQWRSGA